MLLLSLSLYANAYQSRQSYTPQSSATRKAAAQRTYTTSLSLLGEQVPLRTLATTNLSLEVCALPCTGEELTPELLKEQAAQWVWRLRCTGLMLALPSLDEAAEDLKGLASYDGKHMQPGSHADALLTMAVGMASYDGQHLQHSGACASLKAFCGHGRLWQSAHAAYQRLAGVLPCGPAARPPCC